MESASPQRVQGAGRIVGIDAGALYDALLSRDRRFDGRMFVAVRSTRIYCRPICTVRPPRLQNCTFYRTAAACEAAGYRPCLRCRPELAPGLSASVDAIPQLAALAIRRIEDGALSNQSLDDLAAEFGVTARHLRRAVRQEAGLSPIELAQTQRLLMAKQLLTDTSMSVAQAAFSAGFESLRRFNVAFKQRYRLTPTSLRKSAKLNGGDPNEVYAFDLAIRPPFDLAPMLQFWKVRATKGVEAVADGWYRRTVVLGQDHGWLEIGRGRKDHTVRVAVSTGLGPALSNVLCRVKAMLDVRANSVAIEEHLRQDGMLAPLLNRYPGPRVSGTFDGYECGVRTILGQQIRVQAATTVAGRMADRFGDGLNTPYDSLTKAFPSARTLAATSVADLRSLGLSERRAQTIQSFSSAVAAGEIRFEAGADPDRLRARLLAVPGIGNWTVEYLLLRAVAWPDAFPATDLGLVKASGLSAAELRTRSERWRPWRSYAAVLLWNSLNRQD